MALTGVQKTVLVCVASIALVVGAVVNKVTRPAPLDRNALQQAGVYLFDSPRALPEVSLRSAADQPWGLDDLNGQWDLLFFGYTFCPDICPTTLAELRQLMQKHGEPFSQEEIEDFLSVAADKESGLLHYEDYIDLLAAQ